MISKIHIFGTKDAKGIFIEELDIKNYSGKLKRLIQ